MHNFEVHKQHTRLQSLIKQAADACNNDAEALSHWAKYLCIVTAGFLENSIKEIYGDFVLAAAPEPVAKFAKSKLLKINNPKASTFLETAACFKQDWRDDLMAYLQEDGRGDAIDSIMNFRHQIAHGKENNVNVTLVTIKEYIKKSVEVIDYIEKQCRK